MGVGEGLVSYPWPEATAPGHLLPSCSPPQGEVPPRPPHPHPPSACAPHLRRPRNPLHQEH